MVSLYQHLKITTRHYRQKLRRQITYHLNIKHHWRISIRNQNGRRISSTNGATEPRSPDNVTSDEQHIRRQKTLTESLTAKQLKIYHQQNLEVDRDED